jgi:hypothetical protein
MTKILIGGLATLLTSLLLIACNESAQGGDTQTNWLKECQVNAECGDLECLCGRCTRPCQASECGGISADAVCSPGSGQAVQSLCEGSESPALCLRGCDTTEQCGSAEQCLEGVCAAGISAPIDPAGDASGFCQLWIDSFAAYMDDCGCGGDASARYREQAADLCALDGPFGGLAAAVELGELRYDAAAATALFARLDAPAPLCVEEPFRNLRLDSLEVYSLAGAFTGTRALGQTCRSPVSYKGGINDCSEGVCASDGAGAGVCIALVGVGQQCDASGDENLLASSPRLCHATRPSDSDGEYEHSFDAVSCHEGVCAENLADGLPCRLDELCRSGRCAGDAPNATCQPKAAPGEACSTSNDCLTGACRHDLTPRVCGELLADGLPCAYDDTACASGNCSDGSDGGVCLAPASAANGSACLVDQECVGGGVCRGERCFADICGDYLD